MYWGALGHHPPGDRVNHLFVGCGESRDGLSAGAVPADREVVSFTSTDVGLERKVILGRPGVRIEVVGDFDGGAPYGVGVGGE